MLKNIWNNPVIPVYWGKNMPGMQAAEELDPIRKVIAIALWHIGGRLNLLGSFLMYHLGVHKQLANRNTEYYSYIKTVMTTTDLENFFELRDDEAAQPEFHKLAILMREAVNASTPMQMQKGEWHLPYIECKRDADTGILEYFSQGIKVSANIAKKVSVSCCAQVSYRSLDFGVDKALMIFDRLIGSSPKHFSPFEHVATPSPRMLPHRENIFSMGITGYDRNRCPTSGNFTGWLQYRHLLDDVQFSGII